jgi:hypothetical protein
MLSCRSPVFHPRLSDMPVSLIRRSDWLHLGHAMAPISARVRDAAGDLCPCRGRNKLGRSWSMGMSASHDCGPLLLRNDHQF